MAAIQAGDWILPERRDIKQYYTLGKCLPFCQCFCCYFFLLLCLFFSVFLFCVLQLLLLYYGCSIDLRCFFQLLYFFVCAGKQLGQPGAYGVCQLGEEKKTGKKWAVKCILKSRLRSPREIANQRNEIAIMQRLSKANHPNVVSFKEVGTGSTFYRYEFFHTPHWYLSDCIFRQAFEDAQYVYLVMEFMEGGEVCVAFTVNTTSRCFSFLCLLFFALVYSCSIELWHANDILKKMHRLLCVKCSMLFSSCIHNRSRMSLQNALVCFSALSSYCHSVVFSWSVTWISNQTISCLSTNQTTVPSN